MPFLEREFYRLHYRTAGTAGAPAILLVHSFRGSCADWDLQIATLAADHFVILVDLIGHGRSSAPAHECDLTLGSVAADLAAVLSAEGIERSHIIGHAAGGAIAQAFALEFRQRVRALVLDSTSPEPLPKGELAAAAIAARRDPAARQGGAHQAGAGSDDDVSDADSVPLQLNEGFLAMARAMIRSEGFVDQLETITCPTLVLVGETAGPFLQNGAELLHGWIPFSRLVRLPGAGNTPQTENPERYNREVSDFLREVETTA